MFNCISYRMHQLLTFLQVLARCHHLVSHSSTKIRLITIDMIADACRVLSHSTGNHFKIVLETSHITTQSMLPRVLGSTTGRSTSAITTRFPEVWECVIFREFSLTLVLNTKTLNFNQIIFSSMITRLPPIRDINHRVYPGLGKAQNCCIITRWCVDFCTYLAGIDHC